MITFSKFLFESIFKRYPPPHVKDDIDDDHPGSYHRYETHNVINNGHNLVQVKFKHSPHDHGHNYEVGFWVDNSPSRVHSLPPKHAMNILHHVKETIHQFIKEKKPISLEFEGSDTDEETTDKKGRAYLKFANSIAKRYNAEVEHDTTSSMVYFPDHVDYHRTQRLLKDPK